MSEEVYKKVRLKTEPHPNSYKVVWVNNTNLKIHERCIVTYSIGSFRDQILCDVLPLKVCHLLLGRPWLYNKKVQQCRFKNPYTFQHGKKKTMVPRPHVLDLKFKKFVGPHLLYCIPSGGTRILGPPPNSTRLGSFQRRGNWCNSNAMDGEDISPLEA